MERDVIKRCSIIIVDKLDIESITPHLISHGLLTENDLQMLLNHYITQRDKTKYLLRALYKKETGFLNEFIYCLHQTRHGTGHGELAKVLSTTYKELSECNVRTDMLMMSQTAKEASHRKCL